MKTVKKSEEEQKAVREAMKRNVWINNVKRIQNLTQEEAEKLWDKVYNQKVQ